jgi:hypothetical protein
MYACHGMLRVGPAPATCCATDGLVTSAAHRTQHAGSTQPKAAADRSKANTLTLDH